MKFNRPVQCKAKRYINHHAFNCCIKLNEDLLLLLLEEGKL